jgi:hypothetical protein
MATRQQRRALLRDAMRIVAERGFSSNLGRWNVVAAARLLLDVLTGRSPQRASDTARRVVELYDRSLQNNPATPEPACRRRLHILLPGADGDGDGAGSLPGGA